LKTGDMLAAVKSAVPLYYRLQQHLEKQISEGRLKLGGRFPSEAELIREYGVSRTTVRKAIQELERLELIEIRRGKGTYVRSAKIIQELDGLTGFVEDMMALGFQPSAKVLETRIVDASEEVARQLQIPVGSPVNRIKRVRIADDVPISLDETYLPLEVGRNIVKEDLRVYPIFSLLEEKYDTVLLEAEYRLGAVPAGLEIARALGIRAKDAVLLIERTSYTVDRRPVDYEKLYYCGNRIGFLLRLTRRRPSFRLQDMPGVRP